MQSIKRGYVHIKSKTYTFEMLNVFWWWMSLGLFSYFFIYWQGFIGFCIEYVCKLTPLGSFEINYLTSMHCTEQPEDSVLVWLCDGAPSLGSAQFCTQSDQVKVERISHLPGYSALHTHTWRDYLCGFLLTVACIFTYIKNE